MNVREKLSTLFQDCNNPSWKWFPNNAEMMKLIDYLIAYDVTVQKHGTWEIHDEYYFCTNCYSEWKETFAYCPCCGAKMKGDKNGLD